MCYIIYITCVVKFRVTFLKGYVFKYLCQSVVYDRLLPLVAIESSINS